jgi:hypothetical protein
LLSLAAFLPDRKPILYEIKPVIIDPTRKPKAKTILAT